MPLFIYKISLGRGLKERNRVLRLVQAAWDILAPRRLHTIFSVLVSILKLSTNLACTTHYRYSIFWETSSSLVIVFSGVNIVPLTLPRRELVFTFGKKKLWSLSLTGTVGTNVGKCWFTHNGWNLLSFLCHCHVKKRLIQGRNISSGWEW